MARRLTIARAAVEGPAVEARAVAAQAVGTVAGSDGWIVAPATGEAVPGSVVAVVAVAAAPGCSSPSC